VTSYHGHVAFIFECEKGRFIKSAVEGAAQVIKQTFFASKDLFIFVQSVLFLI
jgi:hypothetical protein